MRSRQNGGQNNNVNKYDRLRKRIILNCNIQKSGDLQKAEAGWLKLLPQLEKAFGSNNPEIAQCLNNLGEIYKVTGRYAEAEDYYQRSLVIREQVLGPVHPDTAGSLNGLAWVYLSTGRYTEAEDYYQRSLVIREQALGQDHPDTARSLNGLGCVYANTDRYSEAEDYYQRALVIREQALGPDHPDTASSLSNLARMYTTTGRYAEAEDCYQRALIIREQALGPDNPDTACSLNGLGVMYEKTGRYAEAEDYYQRALVILKKTLGPDHPDTADILYNLAIIYDQTGRYATAEDYCRRALTIREQVLGPYHPDIAHSLNVLAVVYKETGRYAEAEDYNQRALVIREYALGPDHPDTAMSLSNLGVCCIATGRYADAEDYCKKALAIKERAQGLDHQETVSELNNLAVIYSQTGRYAEEEDYHRRALAICEQALGPDHPDTALCLSNLACCYEATSRYAESEYCDRRALAIREQALGPDHPNTALSIFNLAGSYLKTGRCAEAEDYYRQSLVIREQALGPDHPDTATSLFGLGTICSVPDRYAEAEGYLKRCLAIRARALGWDHPATALCLHNLAWNYSDSGRYAEATDYFQRSLAIEERADYPDTAGSLFGLGTICRETGRFAEAESYIIQALTLCAVTLGFNHSYTANILTHLSVCYQETDRLNAAILFGKLSVNAYQTVRRNVSGMENDALSSFDKSITYEYERLSDLLIKAGRYSEAEYVMGMLKEKEQFELLSRGCPLDSLARSISYNDVEVPMVSRFGELGTTLYDLGKQEETLKQLKVRTSVQELQLTSMKEQIKEVNKVFLVFLDNIHKTLLTEITKIDDETDKMIDLTNAYKDTVAIFTVTAENCFHRVLVTPHGRKAFSSDSKATDLATKVLTFRELIKDPGNSKYLDLAKELYEIIIRPMEQELLSNGINTLLWMLNGALRLLPIAALHDGTRFMVEKFQNVSITTLSKIMPSSHVPWNGLGMGVTHEHGGHQALPAVKDELEGIIKKDNSAGIIPGDILLDEAFTRESMELHLEGGYKIVHFASHFELNPVDDTKSYLLLGDGSKIRMDELRCSTRLFKGVDLVAFSACSTGLGTTTSNGREVDGIGYLGERQGAQTVLATLWPVEDKSTSMLMREFYRLREGGMTKAEALQQAQLCLLHGKFKSDDGSLDFAHPYFWAPFILIGSGG